MNFIFVTDEVSKELTLLALRRAEHPSKKLEQLIGSSGLPVLGRVVRLEHP